MNDADRSRNTEHTFFYAVTVRLAQSLKCASTISEYLFPCHIKVAWKLNADDQRKFHTFWLGFVHHFFGVKVTDTSKCLPPEVEGTPTTESGEQDAAADAASVKDEAAAAALAAMENGPKLETGEGAETVSEKEKSAEPLRRIRVSTRQKAAKKFEEDAEMEIMAAVAEGAAGGEEEEAEETPGAAEDEEAAAEGSETNTTKVEEVEKDTKGKRKRRNRRTGRSGRKKESESDTNSEGEGDSTCIAPPIRLNLNLNAVKTEPSQFRPLRVMMDTWALEEKQNPVRRHTRPSKLFMGNHPYYVFFRLHQFLYDRLRTAKELSAKKHRRSAAKNKTLPITPEGRYKRFKEMLFQLLDNEMESSKFEDECRVLLGASSFALFTINKLIYQVVKQCQSLLQNANCMNLLSLYQYEYSRASKLAVEDKTLERSAEAVRMYHTNCAAIIGDNECCQFEFFDDTFDLGIGIMEGLTAFEPKTLDEDAQEYLATLLSPVTVVGEPVGAPCHLNRNMRRYLRQPEEKKVVVIKGSKKKGVRGNRAAAAAAVASSDKEKITDVKVLFRDVETNRGLEMMVDSVTHKLIFVDDTSESFIRYKAKGKVRRAQKAALEAVSEVDGSRTNEQSQHQARLTQPVTQSWLVFFAYSNT